MDSSQAGELGFAFQPGIEDRGGDQTLEAEGGFQEQHRQQQFPGFRLDMPADDAGIEEDLWSYFYNNL